MIGIQYVGGATLMIREYPPLHFFQAVQDEKCSAYFAAPRSLSDSKMKSSINSDRIFYKTAAMARFVSVDS